MLPDLGKPGMTRKFRNLSYWYLAIALSSLVMVTFEAPRSCIPSLRYKLKRALF